MVIAPLLAGYLYEIYYTGPYIVSAFLLFLGVYFALMLKRKKYSFKRYKDKRCNLYKAN